MSRADDRTPVPTAVCFVVPLVLYAGTAARTVQGGDSGEYALLGTLGGVAHPPGYPLYGLLARLGTELLFGPPFFRVALISSLCGAATCAVLQRIGYRLTGSVFASVAAALLFAVSRTQWRLSGLPEVFTLNALIAATVLLMALRLAIATRAGREREALLLGLSWGLGLSNHLSILWCAPIVLGGIVAASRDELRSALPRLSARAALGGALGLLPYASLPILARTAAPGALVWGRVDTWQGFVDHLLRKEYGTFRLTGAGDAALFHEAPLRAYLDELPAQFAWLVLPLVLVGLVLLLRDRRSVGVPLLASFLLAGPFFVSLLNTSARRIISITIEERFHLLPTTLLVPCAAVGIAWLTNRMSGPVKTVLFLALWLPFTRMNHAEANWSADSFIERYLAEAVREVSPNAVIVGSTDTDFFGTRWVTQVLRTRPDVRYVDIAVARSPWYQDQLTREIPGLPPSAFTGPAWRLVQAVEGSGHSTWVLHWANISRNHFDAAPAGFVDRVVLLGTAPPPLEAQELRLQQATDALGEQPPRALDVYGMAIRADVGERWAQLAARFERAGEAERAASCRTRADALTAPEWSARR